MRRSTITRVLIIAVPLSFAWEMLQAQGFTGMPAGWLAATGVCALAAVVDGLIVVALFGVG